MAWAPIALVVASAFAQALSSYESGRMQRKSAETSAALAERDASNARAAAQIKAENYQEEARRRMAKIRADYAAAGVTTEGTPLLVMMESAREAERDVQRIRWGGEAQASVYQGEAGLQRIMGKNAYTQGVMGAGTSLLSGASMATAMYYGKK